MKFLGLTQPTLSLSGGILLFIIALPMIFPRAASVPAWLAGAHAGIALRVTAHEPAAALCRAFGGALVSTSANRHGEPPARSAEDVKAAFGDEVDAILNAPVGGLERPTPIRDAMSGASVRS